MIAFYRDPVSELASPKTSTTKILCLVVCETSFHKNFGKWDFVTQRLRIHGVHKVKKKNCVVHYIGGFVALNFVTSRFDCIAMKSYTFLMVTAVDKS